MNVTYISGPTGVGKTRSVREGCGYANCYSVSDYKHPFDGYRVKQQSCLMSSTTVSLSSICCNILTAIRWSCRVGMLTSKPVIQKYTLSRICRQKGSTVHCRTRSLKRGPPSCDALTLCGFLPLMEAIRIIPPTIISGSVLNRNMNQLIFRMMIVRFKR